MHSLLLLALACSDYRIGEAKDVSTPGETGDTEQIDTSAETGGETAETGILTDTVPLEQCETTPVPGFATGVDPVCDGATTSGSGDFDMAVEWNYGSFSVSAAATEIMHTPLVVQLTDDTGDGVIDEHDTPDVLAVTFEPSDYYGSSGVLRALHGDGSGEIWSAAGQGLQGSCGIAAGDLDGDGFVEIVAITASKEIKAFEHDGRFKWATPAYASDIHSTGAFPAIADLDADGSPEVIVGAIILNANGSPRGVGTAGNGNPTWGNLTIAADLDGDGQQEVIAGDTLYDADANILASLGGEDGYTAAADMDGDGEGEIVVSEDGRVVVKERDGTVLWFVNVGSNTGPVTIADLDGDGEPEVSVQQGSEHSAFETDGRPMWTVAVDDGSGKVTAAAHDFDSDGSFELVLADESAVRILDGATGGALATSTDHSSLTFLDGAVVADVDGDGEAEIVVGNNAGFAGITVLGSAKGAWGSARGTWNQHAYHITNVDDDGSIPTSGTANWPRWNSFRATTAPLRSDPDPALLEGGMCELDCALDRLVLHVHPGNLGPEDTALATRVDLYAVTGAIETLLDYRNVPAGLIAGEWAESEVFVIEGANIAAVESLIVRITGSENCSTENDEIEIAGPFCGG